ncbi:MAG: hypothetical protein ACK50Y_01270 [Flavobacteriia bacterium]
MNTSPLENDNDAAKNLIQISILIRSSEMFEDPTYILHPDIVITAQ